MTINEIRIYAEVLEQGLDFKEYLIAAGFHGTIKNVYTKKARGEFNDLDSVIDRIRKVKDVDVLISAISEDNEYPLLMVEYSTAVPTDDHKWQRSDVQFWAAVLKVPMMKISPSTKGMDQDFGGGARITDEQEQFVAFQRNAIFYPIAWDIPEGVSALPTKAGALSCIPQSDAIQGIVESSINKFLACDSYNSFYEELLHDYSEHYSESLNQISIRSIKENIVDSTRFHWYDDKLCVKINRFGHAMDPDRGILYFANMLVGAENTITEIQVNRSNNPASRGGYNALFDALSRKEILLQYVQGIIEHFDNTFSDENALYVLTRALNIENSLTVEAVGNPHEYRIGDDVLRRFLMTHPSIVSKTIFFLSTELRLTDRNRRIICRIKWNQAPIIEYLNSVCSENYRKINIEPLTMNKAKEDIITFASVELYKKMQCELLAVSYPGAQGDRCILTGSGRAVLRTYVDIIAYKTSNNGVQVFLEECKEKIAESKSDVDKLKSIITDNGKIEGLKLLFRKTVGMNFTQTPYISVAAKSSQVVPHLDVDYIMMFDLENDDRHTMVNYSVAVVNTALIPSFMSLAEDDRRLSGKIQIDKVYAIQ